MLILDATGRDEQGNATGLLQIAPYIDLSGFRTFGKMLVELGRYKYEFYLLSSQNNAQVLVGKLLFVHAKVLPQEHVKVSLLALYKDKVLQSEPLVEEGKVFR
jgi:hypothetical protein